MKNFVLILFVLVFSITHLTAQTDSIPKKDIFDYTLEELMKLEVISSTKVLEKKEFVPNIITVFPRKLLDNFAFNNIDQLTAKHQGFFPSQDYDRRTVGVRGISEGWNNNHLLMLIDGIPFNDNLYGSAYTWEITPLFFTKSIEIIRGPGAALYGSNATNGVITINTISPSDYDGKKLLFRTQFGERNTQIHDLLAMFSTKNFDIVTSFSYRKTDGLDYNSYDASGRLDANGKAIRYQVPDDRQSYYVFVKLEGKDKFAGLNFQYHRQGWEFKTGNGWLWQIPDKEETMKESRDIFSLKYEYSKGKKIIPEIVVRYQIHNIDWDMWYYPTGAFDNYYPDGVNEYLKTSGQDLFTRLQLKFNLPNKINAIIGVEPTMFFYNGDKEHYTNTDLNDEQGLGWAPYDSNQPLGDWLEYINGKPVTNIGSFLHVDSGDILGESVKFTFGLRYDDTFFDYVDINETSRPTKNKKFEQFSPRAALIVVPSDKLSFKLTAGRAFRAPTPTEMFGSNTWTLASNLQQLKAETVSTYDAELNYDLGKNFHLNLVTYYTNFEGLIAYSLGNNNLSTNIYDIANVGLEMGLTYSKNNTYGFLNYSYTKRIDETIFEAEKPWISEDKDKLTWTPSSVVNFGISQQIEKLNFSLSGHWQSKVARRKLDIYSQAEYNAIGFNENPRDFDVASWFSLDAKVAYKFSGIELGIVGKNLFGGNQYLVKSLKNPFDYKVIGRRVSFYLSLEL